MARGASGLSVRGDIHLYQGVGDSERSLSSISNSSRVGLGSQVDRYNKERGGLSVRRNWRGKTSFGRMN